MHAIGSQAPSSSHAVQLAGEVRRHLEGWKRHKPLWQESKAAALEKFVARGPDTSAWEQQMKQYTTLAAELTAQVLTKADANTARVSLKLPPVRCPLCSHPYRTRVTTSFTTHGA